MYEFLPAIGTLVAIIVGWKKLFGRSQAAVEPEAQLPFEAQPSPANTEPESNTSSFGLFFGLSSATWG
jgi:hypothetical protein